MRYEGTYKIFCTQFCSDGGVWSCTLVFNGLEVTASAASRRRAVKRAEKSMSQAQKWRTIVKSIKGICDEL